MIALLTAGRGGGDARPVYQTVPWWPGIERHIVPEHPGVKWRVMRSLIEQCQKEGFHPSDFHAGHLLTALLTGGCPLQLLMFEETRKLVLLLEMFPAREKRP